MYKKASEYNTIKQTLCYVENHCPRVCYELICYKTKILISEIVEINIQ